MVSMVLPIDKPKWLLFSMVDSHFASKVMISSVYSTRRETGVPLVKVPAIEQSVRPESHY